MATPKIVPADAAGIARAAERLRGGAPVAFPTETVYGLGACASDPAAVENLYSLKGRPPENPLIAHVADPAMAAMIAAPDDRAMSLMEVFWPGPLTLVLPLRDGAAVCAPARAGLETVALRCPSHPVATALLGECGFAVAAPSANLSGRLSPTTPMHVAAGLPDADIWVLAGGKAAVGLESTIVDLSGEEAVLLRPGSVTAEDLEAVIGPLQRASAPGAAPKAPGQLSAHYAPRTPLRLNATDAAPGEALLAFGPLFGDSGAAAMLNLSDGGDLAQAAANLFAMLHELDGGGYEAIAVMPIPEEGIGAAINDRLRRAAASSA